MRRRHLLTALPVLALTGAAALGVPAWVRRPSASVPAGGRFGLGVASGTPRADGMVLWTRLTGPDLQGDVPVEWVLAEDEAFRRVVAQGQALARAEDAHTLRAEPQGLASDRVYWYRFEALGERSPAGRTRTAPAAGAAVAAMRFVIASCQRWDHGHWAAWRDAVDFEPDLVIFLGDYLYEGESPRWALRRHEGGPCLTLEDYRARHAQYRSDPLLQAAHAVAPWALTWDDHEVVNDYAGDLDPRRDPAFPARRAAAYRAWWEHMPVPAAWRPAAHGLRLYHRLDWGALARLHVADLRQYRAPQACPLPGRAGTNLVTPQGCPELADPGRSMMGRAQERWLDEGWSLDHPWNLLAQATLMAPFQRRGVIASRVWTDGWEGYAPARQRLLDTLAARRVPGAVVLSGDVHGHYVAHLHARPNDPDSPVLATEFCGTSISSRARGVETVRDSLPLNPHVKLADAEHRGLARFVLTPQQLQAELRTVVDVDDPSSARRTRATFTVEAGRPGVA